uniref:Uncharacterized protein n=1 Tax=Knipowitschia caucasica TaxID=637954 RepID=A0AAV2KCK5_KNICA
MRDAGARWDGCGYAECVWLGWDRTEAGERGVRRNCPHRWVKCEAVSGRGSPCIRADRATSDQALQRIRLCACPEQEGPVSRLNIPTKEAKRREVSALSLS